MLENKERNKQDFLYELSLGETKYQMKSHFYL